MKTTWLYLLCIGSFLFLPAQHLIASDAYFSDEIFVSTGHVLSHESSTATNSVHPPDSIVEPWASIDITGEWMKPFYPPVVVTPFPIVPVLAGVVGAGVVTYFLVKPNKEDDDCAFDAVAQAQSSTCGLSDGGVSLTVTPEAEYTYLWSNGSTVRDLNNVAAGVYTVSITRTGTNCISVVSATVENTNLPFTVSITSENADCGDSNGTASATINPAGDYILNWSNGSSSPQLTDLSPGTYSLTVTSDSGCTEVASTTVEENTADFTVTISSSPSACGLSDGTATAAVEPQGAYTYQWSNGGSSSTQMDLTPGTYTVTVTQDGTSCSQENSVTIGELPPSFTLTFNSTLSECGESNGSASVIVDPPGTYIYMWSNGETGELISDLSPGIYSVTVTVPGSDCSATGTANVDEGSPGFEVSSQTFPSDCGLSTGVAQLTVVPDGAYTFQWSNGGSSAEQSNLAPGTYQVTVTIDGTTCSKEISVTIDELPPSITLTFNSTPSDCGASNGSAGVQVDPPGTYTFLWSNGEMGELISGISAGTYSVTVTVPGSNCSVSGIVTVDDGSSGFEVTSETFPSDCGLSTGVAQLTVVPDGAYTFQWSNGGSSAEQNDLAAGTYQVTVTIDGTSCSKEISVTIDELPPTMMLAFESTPAGCGIANGSASVIVSPSGAYDYLWSNGAMESALMDLASGMYTVTVSVAGSTCSVTGTVEVGQSGGGFTGTFTTEKADCGLTNGSATLSVDPPDEYTYLWSNQQTEMTLTDVEGGTYTVTVTDQNLCTEVFTVSIGENPAEYITINSTSPANCIASGEIAFTLTTPGDGPLTLLVEGPLGIEMFSLASGVHLLSSLINVVAGDYMLTVYDESIGPECQDEGTAIVIDNTPDLEANDDFFITSAGEVLSANALTNDGGLMIEMTDVFNEFGGTVSFDQFGDFVFTPDPGFFGEASFFYTITDACGMMSTALVIITVEMVDCEFDAFFETIPASCGLEDGSISVEVSEPGVYTYEWSNGDSGSSLTDVEADSYTVTIMDVNLGCALVFTENIDELPADYVDDIIVTQPTCGGEGEIQFTVFTSSQNQLVISVIHPNGSDNFFVNPGIIMLSDFISITPGDYSIEVMDAGAGPDCFEEFDVTIEPSAQIEIFVEGVFPPTEPTAMDGSAIIIISVPGTPPYTVLLNGLPIFDTSDPVFTIEGLDIGEYTVQVIDAEGCTSNEVMFFVPFPPITQSFGTSIIYLTPHVSNEQPAYASSDYMIRTAMLFSLEYYLRSVRQEWWFAFSPPVYAQGISYQPYAELLCFTDLTKYKFKDVRLALQGGLGSAFGSHPVALQESKAASPLWSLRASAAYAHKRTFKLQGSISLQGWEEMQRPMVELSATFSLR